MMPELATGYNSLLRLACGNDGGVTSARVYFGFVIKLKFVSAIRAATGRRMNRETAAIAPVFVFSFRWAFLDRRVTVPLFA